MTINEPQGDIPPEYPAEDAGEIAGEALDACGADGWGLLDEKTPLRGTGPDTDADTVAGSEPVSGPSAGSVDGSAGGWESMAVLLARAALKTAAAALEAAQDVFEDAVDAYDDATGVSAVAEAKVEEISSNSKAAESAKIGAYEALAKAQRRQKRAQVAADRAEKKLNEAAAAHSFAAQQLAAELSDPTPDPVGQEPELCYPTLDDFVREWLTPTYRRLIKDRNGANGGTSFVWEAQWWRHPEAMVRLEALWRAFEHLRQDPALGMSVFLRDHADHHVPILLSKAGPFRRSADETAEDGAPLPYTAPPPGLFTTDESGEAL